MRQGSQVSQLFYSQAATHSRNAIAKALKDPRIIGLVKRAREVGNQLAIDPTKVDKKYWNEIWEHPTIKAAGRELLKAGGLTTSLGYNFYDLRGPAILIFPLQTPFIQSIGKKGAVNAGVGTVAHWKATRNPNNTYVYAGLQEGTRNALATPDENDYFATYKEFGMEGGETFTTQWAGEGFTDNLADEHFRNLARLRLQEEMMTLWGNAGPSVISNATTGNLGFALGKPTTPQGALITVANGGGTSPIGNNCNVVVAVVAITAMGMAPGGQAGYYRPPSVANGVTGYVSRTGYDGSVVNINCGVGILSNINAVATTNAAAQTCNATTTAIKGAVAYAWYWGLNVAATTGTINLGAITSWPWVVISNVAAGMQLANAVASPGTSDYSYCTLDFDGLGTQTFVNGAWTDMGGGSFTSAGNGMVNEVETDLYNLYTNYQATVDAIWCSPDVRRSLDQAIVYSAQGTNSILFTYTRDQQNNLLGGFTVSAYQSKYAINPQGGTAIPIRLHPMFPPGTLMYDITTVPPAYAHARIPTPREFLLQRDYYAIEWPVVTRQWTFGTYIHEVLAHYMPWITSVRTGIGSFAAPCWLA